MRKADEQYCAERRDREEASYPGHRVVDARREPGVCFTDRRHHGRGQRRNGDGAALTTEVVRLNPSNSRAWLWCGFVKVWQGEYAFARDCYERTIRINPLEPYDFLALLLGIGWTRLVGPAG